MDQTLGMRLNTDKKQLLTGEKERGVLQSLCDCSHTQIPDNDFVAYQRNVGFGERRDDGAAAVKAAEEGITVWVNDLHDSKKP